MVAAAREMAAIGERELVPPDLLLLLLRSTGDTITVMVVRGTVPVDPRDLIYVRGRGAYEVLRSGAIPSHRRQLTLAAWPRLEN
jgi:hypothetical protein